MQSFLPRSGLGIKPRVSNPRLCQLLSCPDGTQETLAGMFCKNGSVVSNCRSIVEDVVNHANHFLHPLLYFLKVVMAEQNFVDENDIDLEDRTKRYFGDLYQRLQQYPILVVGAGAVGTEVVKNLAMLGVRKIYLVDFDKVSMSNLNRCIFFMPQDHGLMYKVHAVARYVSQAWQHTELIPYAMAIQDAPEEVWQVPIVILAVDNNEARYYCNLRALSSEQPPFLINGAMGRTFFALQVLLPGETSCLVCSWSPEYVQGMFRRIVRESCDQFFVKTSERFPAISVLNSMIGAMMASETTKILVGLEQWKQHKQWEPEHQPILGQALRYDIATHEFSIGKLIPNPECVEVFCKIHRQAAQ